MKRKLTNIVIVLLALIALGAAGYAVYMLTHPEEEAVKRQETEESLAAAYIEALGTRDASETDEDGKSEESGTGGENGESTSGAETNVADPETAGEATNNGDEAGTQEGGTGEDASASSENPTYEDLNYYVRDGVTYTPEYAQGTLLGVLEVDRSGICRGVYGGSWEAINHDLDIWMVTAARPDYVLGETHFVIYGHNHPVQDLSFNRLKDVQVGDVITFTTDSGVYIYDVTDFYADWRETATAEVVDNFSLPADKLYILTCGRNEYRYKDIIVVGTLRCVIDPETYLTDPDYYKYDPAAIAAQKGEPIPGEEETESAESTEAAVTEAEAPKLSVTLSVSCTEEGVLRADCVGEDGSRPQCELAILDADGLSIVRWTQGEEEMPEFIPEDNTEYVFGVLRMKEDGYETPQEIVFKFHEQSLTEIPLEVEPTTDETGVPYILKPIIAGLIVLILVLLIMLLLPKKKKKRKGETSGSGEARSGDDRS